MGRPPFTNSFAPGPKAFDIHLTQVTYKHERAEAVDLSEATTTSLRASWR